MADQQSIVVIFDLLNNTAPVTPGVSKVIENISRSYPYFLPARYIKAADIYKNEGYSSSFFATIRGYHGNWLLFSEFLNGIPNSAISLPPEENEPVVEKEFAPANIKKKVESVFEEPFDATTNNLPSKLGKTGRSENAGEAIKMQEAAKAQADSDRISDAIFEDAVIEEVLVEAPTEPKKEQRFTEKANAESKIAESVSEIKRDDVLTTKIPEPVKADTEQFKRNEEFINSIFSTGAVIEESKDEVLNVGQSNNIVIDEKPNIEIEDYFKGQGTRPEFDLPENIGAYSHETKVPDEDKQLMVLMSFEEWLLHFRNGENLDSEEAEEKKALKSIWQKEKLAAALEEENEEIPEAVFDLAMTSIAREDDLASEALADIFIRQGKYEKAIDMYRKLSLHNPEKSGYFARKIEEVKKKYLV